MKIMSSENSLSSVYKFNIQSIYWKGNCWVQIIYLDIQLYEIMAGKNYLTLN